MLVKFNSKIWKPEDKVVTRDKRNVRIICTDYKGETGHTVIGLVEMGEKETVQEFMTNGDWMSTGCKSENDLFVDITPKFKVGDLAVSKENYGSLLVLVGESNDPRILESIIAIDSNDLSSIIEDNFDPDCFNKASEDDWKDFNYFLAILGLAWKNGHLEKINPVIDFSPVKDGWDVTYEGRTITLSDEEYKDIFGM